MKRTTLVLPDELKRRVERRARETGRSFSEFVREALTHRLDTTGPLGGDPFYEDRAVYTGETPENLASDHDGYLYGEES